MKNAILIDYVVEALFIFIDKNISEFNARAEGQSQSNKKITIGTVSRKDNQLAELKIKDKNTGIQKPISTLKFMKFAKKFDCNSINQAADKYKKEYNFSLTHFLENISKLYSSNESPCEIFKANEIMNNIEYNERVGYRLNYDLPYSAIGSADIENSLYFRLNLPEAAMLSSVKKLIHKHCSDIFNGSIDISMDHDDPSQICVTHANDNSISYISTLDLIRYCGNRSREKNKKILRVSKNKRSEPIHRKASLRNIIKSSFLSCVTIGNCETSNLLASIYLSAKHILSSINISSSGHSEFDSRLSCHIKAINNEITYISFLNHRNVTSIDISMHQRILNNIVETIENIRSQRKKGALVSINSAIKYCETLKSEAEREEFLNLFAPLSKSLIKNSVNNIALNNRKV